MANEDEDLIIDLNQEDDDATTADQAKGAAAGDQQAAAQAKPPPVPGPSGRQAPPPAVGLKDLEAQVAAERAARSRAVEDARRLQQERDNAILFAQEAERRGMSVYELNNENQIKALTDQMDSLEAQHAAAMNEGDFTNAAAINRKMQRLGGDLALAERDKIVLAQQRENMKVQHQRRVQPAQPRQPAEAEPTDPLERAIQGRTEPTKAFLRRHPELIRGDGSLKRTAIDAHESALDAGHTVDTPGYFGYIESIIGPARGEAMNGQPSPTHPRQRAPTMAAPVERGAAPGGSADANTFVMTPKMRRLAEEQGVAPREWALNYIRLLREGRISPIT